MNVANKYMRKFAKYVVAIAAVAVITLISTGCMRQDYLMFEDGEFDGVEFSDYDYMQNAELEMDDIDRNWHLGTHVTILAPFCWFKKY